jgi:hypothetical protein
MAVMGVHLSSRQNYAVCPANKNQGKPLDINTLSGNGILRRAFKMATHDRHFGSLMTILGLTGG